MSRVDMSRRVSRLMQCKAIQDLDPGARRAFVKAVDQADDLSSLTPHHQEIIMAAEKELTDRGYVRDAQGKLVPPEFADKPPVGVKEHKRKKIIVAAKKV